MINERTLVSERPGDSSERERGAELIDHAMRDIAEVEARVTQETGLAPDSAEAVAETDEALVHIARESSQEASEDDAHNAAMDVIVEGALESSGAKFSGHNNPAATIGHDPNLHKRVTDLVAELHDTHATLPDGTDATRAAIDAIDSHPVMNQGPRGVEYIPATRDEALALQSVEKSADANIAFIAPGKVDMNATLDARQRFAIPEQMQIAMVKDTSDILAVDNKNSPAKPDADKNWREKTFGKESIAELRSDTITCLERPQSERVGEPIVDLHTGAERRPIMDIQLDEHSKVCVQEQIAKRSAGLDRALEVIAEMAALPENRRTSEYQAHSLSKYKEALQDLGVWSRQHGNLLMGESSAGNVGTHMESSGGTVADLYLDESDMAKYKQIDAMINEASMLDIDSAGLIADGITNLAANTFPSGVEMMHAVPPDSLEAIVRQGAVAPRSQTLHGVQRRTQLNGGFTHMTMPGTAAYEYTADSHPTVVGIPIDTIMQHSPLMQLEHAYTNNEFHRAGDDHNSSTQYEMGAMTINDVSTAPRVFQAALNSMHDSLETGMRQANIGQGVFNNISFAATSEVTTAAAYQYPLTELSVYSEDYQTIRDLAEKFPDKANIIYGRTKVVESESHGRPISAINLPNFDLADGQPIKVYAPMSSIEVGFTEGSVGNSFNESAREFSRDTIVPGKEAKFMNELVESGISPVEVIEIAIDAVNTKGGFANDIFKSYAENQDVYESAGISAASIVGSLNSTKFNDINLHNSDFPWADAEFVASYAGRLYSEDPGSFAKQAESLQAKGYVLSPEQESHVRLELDALNAENNKSFEVPQGFTF